MISPNRELKLKRIVERTRMVLTWLLYDFVQWLNEQLQHGLSLSYTFTSGVSHFIFIIEKEKSNNLRSSRRSFRKEFWKFWIPLLPALEKLISSLYFHIREDFLILSKYWSASELIRMKINSRTELVCTSERVHCCSETKKKKKGMTSLTSAHIIISLIKCTRLFSYARCSLSSPLIFSGAYIVNNECLFICRRRC